MEFDAVVLSCINKDKYYEVVLDRSAFFPEGGGQRGDVGMLGGSEVTDTVERDGLVIHKCKTPLPEGAAVHGSVNREVRTGRMQNHSGEHLLMGFIHRKTGFDNVGFHLGDDMVTLDLNGVIEEDELLECEKAANEAIAADLPISISYPEKEELAGIEYRSKKEIEGRVRLVTIGDLDICACCAPHMPSTGRIGIVKVLSSEHYKGGTRIYLACGLYALKHIRDRFESVTAVSRLLSAKPEKITDGVKRLLDENGSLKQKIYESEKKKTEDIIAGIRNESRKSFCIFAEGLDINRLRDIANAAVKHTDGAAGVFGREKEGYTYIIASEKINLRERTKEINAAISGRGGGSPAMIQGSASAPAEVIGEFFKTLE